MTHVRILIGDVQAQLANLADESVHCVVTSPPYWGLRSYLPEGSPLKALELGSEATPELWSEKQVEVFREVRRVLRSDGALWVNVGDCYAGGGVRPTSTNKHRKMAGIPRSDTPVTANYKPGDRVQLGPMLSEALRRDGWYLRQTIAWAKGWSFGRFRDDSQGLLWDESELLDTDDAGAVMPGSYNGTRWERHRVKIEAGMIPRMGDPAKTGFRSLPRNPEQCATWRDCPGCPKCEENDGLILRKGSWRPTDAFEYLYLLTKTASYYGDREGVREANAASGKKRIESSPGTGSGMSFGVNGKREARLKSVGTEATGRNLRNVWRIATKSYPFSHYATYPLDLVVPCIKASTSEKGVCPECGAPWARVVDVSRSHESGSGRSGRAPTGKQASSLQGGGETGDVRNGPTVSSHTLGWRPTCHHTLDPVPATVLDPYGGSGTTAEAAAMLERDCILIDLDPRNRRLIRKRLRAVGLAVELVWPKTGQSNGR